MPSHPFISRRSVLAGAGVGISALAVGSSTAHAAPAERGRPSLRAAVAFLATMTNAYGSSGPRLPQSYADELGLFSTAFVYDAALAVCAAIAAGRLDLARAIGDGLVFAQENDPTYDDGRLRQAYNVGPYVFYDTVPSPYGLVLPDGTANIGWQFGFLGTAVGDMAWPGIALVQLHAATGEQTYLDAALRIAEWITTRAVNTGALGGFSFGVTAADVDIPNVSTEHNIDCVAFFTMLYETTGDPDWAAAAARARAFLELVWEPQGGYFYTGSNDGSTINRAPLPLDPQTWSWLALQDPRFARALEWAGSALATTDTPDLPNSQLPDGVTVSGVTFSSASLTSNAMYNGIPVNQHGVWLEGTAQLAAAYADRRAPRDRARANHLLAQVRIAQAKLGLEQKVGGTPLGFGGVVAASSLLDSGFGFGYFQVQHVGATAWYVMAELGANPMQTGGLG